MDYIGIKSFDGRDHIRIGGWVVAVCDNVRGFNDPSAEEFFNSCSDANIIKYIDEDIYDASDLSLDDKIPGEQYRYINGPYLSEILSCDRCKVRECVPDYPRGSWDVVERDILNDRMEMCEEDGTNS